MPTTIIAVRHGETEWNKIEKQQGHLNSDLTGLGVRQAEAMAEGLKGYTIDHFYSSDLGRAVRTAEIISKTIGIPFTTDVRLRERHLGILQGMTKMEFESTYPHEANLFKRHDPDYRIPEGESIRDRYLRCITCVEDLHNRHRDSTLLIVSHGGMLMSLIHRALDLPLNAERSFSLYNGSINSFSITGDGRWRLESWGIIDHLRVHGLATLDDN